MLMGTVPPLQRSLDLFHHRVPAVTAPGPCNSHYHCPGPKMRPPDHNNCNFIYWNSLGADEQQPVSWRIDRCTALA